VLDLAVLVTVDGSRDERGFVLAIRRRPDGRQGCVDLADLFQARHAIDERQMEEGRIDLEENSQLLLSDQAEVLRDLEFRPVDDVRRRASSSGSGPRAPTTRQSPAWGGQKYTRQGRTRRPPR
jgi:hypothetical protein